MAAEKHTRKPADLLRAALPRQRVAILAADIVGYSRLMEHDEDETHLGMLKIHSDILEPVMKEFGGEIIKNTGDGFLAKFANTADATQAATQIQSQIYHSQSETPSNRKLLYRMGLHISDVIEDRGDIYGDGVNVASRLQTYSEPGGIAMSEIAADELSGKEDLTTIDIGRLQLKNRSEAINVKNYRLKDTPALGVGELESSEDARPSVAVLPFRKLVTRDDEYFADGIVDNIIFALGGLSSLFVISRGTTQLFTDAKVDAVSIGRKIGVQYILHGSFQRHNETIRIVTELIDCETGSLIRSDRYDGLMGDLFQFQDEIAEEVAKTIAPHVRDWELKRARRKHAGNMSAYDFVLQALQKLDELDVETFSDARGLLQQAINQDPTYSTAYSYAAWWHSYRIGQEWSPDVEADSNEALRLSEIAFRLDENDALALAIYGHEQSYVARDYEAAFAHFRRALRVCPNLSKAWTLRGASHCFVGEGAEALECAEMGFNLSPLDKHVYFAEHILAQANYILGRYEEALSWSRRAKLHNGRLTSNLRTLAACLIMTNREQEAREVARVHMHFAPNFTVSSWLARTPMVAEVSSPRAEKLILAGLPE